MPAKLTCSASMGISQPHRLTVAFTEIKAGPETLGLKDTQLLTLQETGGPRSNPQIHMFLPATASAPFFVWAGHKQKVYGKGRGEKPYVGCLVLCLRFNQ